MGQFEYVMVLVSIIVGLGIAHILLGIGGVIDRLPHKSTPSSWLLLARSSASSLHSRHGSSRS